MKRSLCALVAGCMTALLVNRFAASLVLDSITHWSTHGGLSKQVAEVDSRATSRAHPAVPPAHLVSASVDPSDPRALAMEHSGL